jgi:hypothetical protein
MSTACLSLRLRGAKRDYPASVAVMSKPTRMPPIVRHESESSIAARACTCLMFGTSRTSPQHLGQKSQYLIKSKVWGGDVYSYRDGSAMSTALLDPWRSGSTKRDKYIIRYNIDSQNVITRQEKDMGLASIAQTSRNTVVNKDKLFKLYSLVDEKELKEFLKRDLTSHFEKLKEHVDRRNVRHFPALKENTGGPCSIDVADSRFQKKAGSC